MKNRVDKSKGMETPIVEDTLFPPCLGRKKGERKENVTMKTLMYIRCETQG